MDHARATVAACGLRSGDLVTETTTPAGPWYRVVAVDAGSALLVDAGDGLIIEIALPGRGGAVLRRT